MAYPYVSDLEVRVISKYFGDPAHRRIDTYVERGGYKALEKALALEPDAVTDEIKASGLRGRGGAGFPTGIKWSFMPKEPTRPHYLLCNADESEPGTFKDRELMRWDPHQLIEGCLIGAYAIRAQHVYIYSRGEFFEVNQILARAVEDAYAKGYAGEDILGTGTTIDITVHQGAGAYICGEETGLMSSLEGDRGEPRVKPPFPAAVGVFGMPSTINNVETLAAVPHIVMNGGDWYRQWGTAKSPGTKLFCVSGHVQKPGNYELPLGFPLIDLIENVCGGIRDGNQLKAVIPGGSSVPLINAEDSSICMLDYEGCEEVGTMLGCASVIVMDHKADIVKQIRRMVDFYAHESCGQCTPCREGSAWTARILRRIEEGKGTEEDLDTLIEMTDQMVGTTICVLSDSVAAPVQSSINKFRDDYLELIRGGERAGAA
ncbi:MAG: NADH-quinone oxidoreductase subunit NuoF [Gemmatimonadota bacterium]|jgi:NADH-quinone oxidoreductase subunit F|nr:NADH-quinone oxidoreductase subunit NuoF [Gemmatimonadota bacterium]MEE3137534.1 NADH-quinone oxidoreductase subunit NuoF [Gemmatimonadota bacterium]|tara:strand:+ start:2500 stop:3792 length:1293 start_codon:yes stop_codon:yes gene_type:complete